MMPPNTKPRLRGWLRLVPLLFVCISAYIFGTLHNDSGRQSTDNNVGLTPATMPQIVDTDTGSYTVPGKAFADGRDQSTNIPITINEILVWDTVDRNEDVCLLKHGEEVTLKAAQYVEREDRYYFEIDAPFCFGWIPETSLSTEKHPPVGQVLP
jgi:hypothetical protein